MKVARLTVACTVTCFVPQDTKVRLHFTEHKVRHNEDPQLNEEEVNLRGHGRSKVQGAQRQCNRICPKRETVSKAQHPWERIMLKRVTLQKAQRRQHNHLELWPD